MRRFLAVLAALVLLGVPAALPAAAVQVPQDGVVSDNPAGFTPHVLDGEVNAIAQVGNTIVLGGAFTQVRAADDETILTRSNLVAFDATTGEISATFDPAPSGAVNAVIPAGDGTSVYVGGEFNTIGGVTRRKVARVSVATGAVVTSFANVAPNGAVNDLRLAGGRLWIGGRFTTIAGQARPALATVDATTGRYDDFMGLTVQGTHNGGTTSVIKMDVTPDGGRLVAIGNFDNVSGVTGHQVVMLDLTGGAAQVASWGTSFYTSTCASAFDSYMRDLDISPDGSFMVISTTGAYRGTSTSCDATARFDLDRTGVGLAPTWVNYTGGDTTYAVAITGSVVYVGGHFRWQNNPFAGDRAAAGAVGREGIAALDPTNGLPLRWNPGRTRGVGVFDMLATPTGLWVGSDTDRIGNDEYHGRIAFFPLSGGTAFAQPTVPVLPGDVVQVAPAGTSPASGVLARVNAGGPTVASSDDGPAWSADTTSTSTLRNSGSSAASYAAGGIATTAAVPATTPSTVFDSERYDPAGGNEMQWSIPVAAGTPVQVRLYFANRASSTASVGQRVFDVSIDGVLVADDYDVVADVGTAVGTMKSYDIVSDGSVTIGFTHVVQNPMVSAIEIVRTPVGGTTAVRTTAFTGTEVGATADLDAGVDLSGVRAAFMADGMVYLASADGSFVRRSFDGATWGAPEPVDGSDLLVRIGAWHTSASRLTGVFLDGGRMYYTQAGDASLRMRYLTLESGVVGAQEFVASPSVTGLDLTTVRGMFLASGWLYWGTADGALHRIQWNGSAPVAGTAQTVSGPAVDGTTWSNRAMFVYQGPGAPNYPPTAVATVSCTDQACDYSAAGSSDVGGSIVGYDWDFGDGETATDAEGTHTYAAPGSYLVTLTVTDDGGATATATQSVEVTYAFSDPVPVATASCDELSCVFDASGSSDADGPVTGYAWDFGDGTTGTGASVVHDYAADGSYQVTLTVTDAQGATASTSLGVEVAALVARIEFVGAGSVNRNANTFPVAVPAAAQPGDVMVLLFAGNSQTPTVTAPAGWALADGGASSTGVQGWAWAKTVAAEDLGATVTVTSSGYLKADATLLVYRGVDQVQPVSAAAVAFESSSSTAHTTPAVPVLRDGTVVSYWGEKSSATTALTVAAPVTQRAASAGAGSGRITAVAGDAGPLVEGTSGGFTAVADSSSAKAVLVSLALRPQG